MDFSIIGGADGPTSIFVSSSVFLPYLIIGVVAVIGAVIAFIFKKRK